MNKNDVFEQLVDISHEHYMMFLERIGNKPNNSFETLKLLLNKEDVTSSVIVEHLDIKPSSVTQILKKLEADDLIEKTKSNDDARVTFIKLTEKGKKTIENRKDVLDEFQEQIFSNFSNIFFKNFFAINSFCCPIWLNFYK